MAENRAALNARVLIGVGPAFDFLTGAKPQPPRWARRIGFEWLIRLSTEPKRMGRRYLRYPLFLLWYSMQLAGLRRYPKPPQPQAAPPLAIDKLPLVIEPTRAEILGVQVGAWEMENLEAYILRTVKSGTRARVFNVNAHALNLAYEQPEVAAAFREAEVGFPDGFGAVLAARLLGTYIRSRVTYADWFWRVAALCEHHGLRIFFLGGRPGVAERAKNALQRVHPGFKVVGCRHGYFDHAAGSEDTKRVVAEINRAQTDLLVVGLGMPLQETWLTQNWGQIEAAVGLTGGAVFDYVSGRLRRPPRLLTDHGLEWLGRMLIEPGRLWRRYLLGNPKFLWRVMRQRLQR